MNPEALNYKIRDICAFWFNAKNFLWFILTSSLDDAPNALSDQGKTMSRDFEIKSIFERPHPVFNHASGSPRPRHVLQNLKLELGLWSKNAESKIFGNL